MIPRIILLMATLVVAACQSSIPTVADMDKFYKEAAAQVDRDVARLRSRLASGEISQEEFEFRAQEIRASLPQRASKMAWARHELVESQKRAQGIPTGDHPVDITPPGRGGAGDSFYRQAGNQGPGYQGMGSGMWHGSQSASGPGSF